METAPALFILTLWVIGIAGVCMIAAIIKEIFSGDKEDF